MYTPFPCRRSEAKVLLRTVERSARNEISLVWSSRNRGIFLELLIRKAAWRMQRVAAGVPSANSRQTRIRIEEGVESPEGQVKTSLSLSLSLATRPVPPCYVNTCVFCCSLSLSGRRDALGASLTNITKVPRVDVAGEASRGRVCTRLANFEAGESRAIASARARTWQEEQSAVRIGERFRKRPVTGMNSFEKRNRTCP